MEIIIHEHDAVQIAEVRSEGIALNDVQDAVDLLGNAYHQGADKLIVHAANIAPAFFDLKTGLAGDVLQKFSNYGIQVAIVGDFESVESNSLRSFIEESNRGRQVAFVPDLDAALETLR